MDQLKPCGPERVKPRATIYVKGYRFLSFAKAVAKNLSKNMVAKKSTTDAVLTAPKRAIQKTAEATGNLIDNKIVYQIVHKITRASKKSPTCLQNDNTSDEIEPPKKDTYIQKKSNILLMN